MNDNHAILWWNTHELLCLTSLCVFNSANQRMFAKRMASSDIRCAVKFHKSVKALPCSCYTKIKHSALGLVRYFSYSTCGNALTNTKRIVAHTNMYRKEYDASAKYHVLLLKYKEDYYKNTSRVFFHCKVFLQNVYLDAHSIRVSRLCK